VTDLFLGIIALSVLLMAVGQVVGVVMAIRASRRVGDALSRLEENVRPIVSNVQQMSSDAARAAALATAQVEKADRIMDDVTRRVDETLAAVQSTILAPARGGIAIIQGIRAAFSVLFDHGERTGHRAHGPSRSVAEDDASFIG